MILREIKNMYIKNRLTEGVDFKRYEWLRSTSAYLSMNVTAPKNQYTISAKTKELIPVVRDTQILGQSIFYWADNNFTMAIINNWISFDGVKAFGNPKNEFEFTLNGSTLIANGTTYTITSKPLKLNKVFYQGGGGGLGFNSGCISYLKVDGLIDLIPCQLLKSIPATLDANKKSRSAGECGMYDSVSGKFYGNVANIGTFTVEGDVEPETHSGLQQIYQNKLIEGVDFKRYEWLKGSVPLGTLMMSLPINSSNCNFTYIWGNNLGNMGVFSTNGFTYYNGNNKSTNTLVVYDLTTAQNIYYKYDITQPTTVNASDDVLMINNSIYPKYGFPITFIRFQNASNGTSEGVKILSSVSVDGVTRYVPCQLLHAIPRNLDAQCKERQAGECGMIDLISGKFYGNVANSGTFTVENDNE